MKMAFYIDTIEQVKAETGVNEYGKREKQNGTYEQALSAYYTKLSNVSNDIITEETPDKNHYFMDIRIVDSKGGVKKKDRVGSFQE
jgi:hypothetical protein